MIADKKRDQGFRDYSFYDYIITISQKKMFKPLVNLLF